MHEFEIIPVAATLEGREVFAHIERDPRGMVERVSIRFDDNGSHGLPSLFSKHDRHDELTAPTFEINWSAWGSQSAATTRGYAQLLVALADLADRVGAENAANLAEHEHEWRGRLVQWEAAEDIGREEIAYQTLRAATGVELAPGDRVLEIVPAYAKTTRTNRYYIEEGGRARRTFGANTEERDWLLRAEGRALTLDTRSGKTVKARKPRATA